MGTTDQLFRPRLRPRPQMTAHRYHEPAARPSCEPGAASRSRPAAGGGGAPIVVAVQASDPLTGAGTVAYLRSLPGIVPVPAAGAPHADVVLILADAVTEDTLVWMRRTARQAQRGRLPFVLVSDELKGPLLRRAVACGPVSVLPRQGCGYGRIVQAILEARQAPAAAAPGPLTAGDPEFRQAAEAAQPEPILLDQRELDVLRLLADGLSTLEIAQQLNYSERTVKHVIHVLLRRLNLRNRPHAVAFALRNGLL